MRKARGAAFPGVSYLVCNVHPWEPGPGGGADGQDGAWAGRSGVKPARLSLRSWGKGEMQDSHCWVLLWALGGQVRLLGSIGPAEWG